MEPYRTSRGRFDISVIPAEIMYNLLLRLPIKLSMRLKCVCKHWNRVISDPHYLTKSWRGDRKILLPFKPVDVFYETDTTRSIVTLNSPPFSNSKLRGKDVTFVGSCNGIVLLVIHDFLEYMVLYNPLTKASKPIPPDSHSLCHNCENHVYGFGYGSSNPDDLKIVRFRGCDQYSSSSNNNNRRTCDVFSIKTNSWTVLKNFVWNNANCLSKVGTFANGSLYWIATRKYPHEYISCKIVALDVNNMVLSDIQVPSGDDGLDDTRLLTLLTTTWVLLGTLNGRLCIVGESKLPNRLFSVYVLTKSTDDGVDEKDSWLNVSEFELKLKREFEYKPICILDNGIILISIINSFQELVIYDVLKESDPPKVINVSASPDYFQRIQGIEYVESLVSPSTLFN